MTSLRSLLARLLVLVMICYLAVPTFGVVQRKPRAKSVATTIRFDNNSPKVTPKQTVEVTATVLDQYGKPMEERVSWPNATQPAESPLVITRSPDDAKANTLIITGKPADAAVRQRFTTIVTATSGDAQPNDLTINYESTPKPAAAKITFSPPTIDLDSAGEATIKANVLDADDKPVQGSKVTWELAKPELKDFVLPGEVVNDDKANSLTVIGRTPKDKSKKAPDAVTMIASVEGRPLGIVTINYKAPPQVKIETVWNILPPNVAGDSYGHTIKNDYYCIVVTIKNDTGSDLALAGLYFNDPDPQSTRPEIMTTPYGITHNSMAKRKLTHPRAMTLAIVDGLGTLMTGFNPFFHDINHAKNYSQFIDILSNPLKSGIEKGWKDPYPDELANFEKDVLKDDKVIPNHGSFTTTVFVPKRLLYSNDKKDKAAREDLDGVRKALGHLLVMGYKFEKGISLTLSDTP